MKWKLFKSPDSSSSSPASSTALTPSSSSSSVSSSSSPDQHPTKKKTIFGFSTKNDSVHSLFNKAFGSSDNNLLRFARSQTSSSQNSSHHTPVPVPPPKPTDTSDSGDGNEDELATTTIYYHPPKEEPLEEPLEDINREIEQLNHRRAAMGQLPQARASDPAIASPHTNGDHSNSGSTQQYHGRPSPLSSSRNRYSIQTDGRIRSGSVPTTAPTTWVPSTPRPRPHDIASLPEQYHQYLQNLQHQQQPLSPTTSIKSHVGEPSHTETVKKLRASIAVVSGSLDPSTGPSPPCPSLSASLSQRSTIAAPSMLSGTARIERNTTALTPVPSQKRSPDDPSYEQLVQIVDNLNGTVEDLSRKIGMMFQSGSPSAVSSPRFTPGAIVNPDEAQLDSCASPVSPMSPVSYSTRSSHDSPLLAPRHLQQHYSPSLTPVMGSQYPLVNDSMWQNESRRSNKTTNKSSVGRNNSQQLQQQQQLQNRRPSRGAPAAYQTLPIQPAGLVKVASSPYLAPASVPSSPSIQTAPSHPPPPVPASPSMSRAKTKPQLYLTGSQSDDNLPLTRRGYHQQGSVFQSVAEEEGDDVSGYTSPPLPLPSHTMIQQSHHHHSTNISNMSASTLVSPPRYLGQYHSLAFATTTTSSTTTNTSTSTNMTMTSNGNGKVRTTGTAAATRLRSTSASATQEKNLTNQPLVRQRSHQQVQVRAARSYTMPIKPPMTLIPPSEQVPSPSERAALTANKQQLVMGASPVPVSTEGPNRPLRKSDSEDLCQILDIIDQKLMTLQIEYPSFPGKRISTGAGTVTGQMKTMGELSTTERRRQSMYLNAELQAMAGKLQSHMSHQDKEESLTNVQEVDEEMEQALQVIHGGRRTSTTKQQQQQQQQQKASKTKSMQTRQLLHEIEEIRARVLQWGNA
ncbi:hypothetical protein B0O80DRAFT_233123 [Mortierella sp. GBAus27b]|nr:hypothetical protein B0O80DRAFT_233123 [Mortierella sp. GBAus27b]